MRFALIVAGGLLGLGSQTAAAADITQIVCNGRANDGQAVNVTVMVKLPPALSGFTIRVGAQETAEIIESLVEVPSEADSQNRSVTIYRARLSPSRSFAARTSDLGTGMGMGMIQISALVRAPLMSCVFN